MCLGHSSNLHNKFTFSEEVVEVRRSLATCSRSSGAEPEVGFVHLLAERWMSRSLLLRGWNAEMRTKSRKSDTTISTGDHEFDRCVLLPVAFWAGGRVCCSLYSPGSVYRACCVWRQPSRTLALASPPS